LTRRKLLVAGAAVAAAASTALVGSQKICACGDPQVGDQTPPSVSVTSPSASTTVSGSVAIAASASDDKGVVGVQFKRAGSTNVGSEDTSAPFTVALDTTALANGSLSLTAVARDAAGNTTTSSAVVVTINNVIVSGTAHLWVDTDGGTCVDNASGVSYATATACGTLAAAVAAAEAGDKIAIRVGTYPFETLAYRSDLQNLSPGCDPYGEWGSASSANCIHIVPDGGDVTIQGLQSSTSSIWMEGNITGDSGAGCGSPNACQNRTYDFHVANSQGNPPSGALNTGCNCKAVQFKWIPSATSTTARRLDHVIIDKIDSQTISVYSSSNVMMRKMDVGPLWVDTSTPGSASGSGPDIPRIWNAGSAGVPENIVVDGNYYHEINRTYDCFLNNACHPDGLYYNSGGPHELRNSGFEEITGEVLFFENFSNNVPNTNNVTVENNWFACKVNDYQAGTSSNPTENTATSPFPACGTGSPIDIKQCGSSGCTNFLFRYNSWYAIEGAETDYTNSRFIGNAGVQPSTTQGMCADPDSVWTYNAFYLRASGGGDCGGTNTNTGSASASSLFSNVTAASPDFHLAGAAGSTVADNLVTPTSADYTVTTDFDGDARTAGSRDAGADER
jgi:hypothetical protein